MFFNLVYESLDDILKPKTSKEIEDSINNTKNLKLINFNLDLFIENFKKGYLKKIPQKAVNLLLKKSCQENKPELIKDLILIHKADINYKDNYGNTPLYQTCKKHALESFKELLKYNNKNLNINIQNREGVTPLMACITPSDKRIDYDTMILIFSTLIEKGADLNIKNNRGYNVQKIALVKGIRPIIYYMQENNLIKYDDDTLLDLIRVGTLKMIKKATGQLNLNSLNLEKLIENININDPTAIGKMEYLISLGAKLTPALINKIINKGYIDEIHKDKFRKFLYKNDIS